MPNALKNSNEAEGGTAEAQPLCQPCWSRLLMGDLNAVDFASVVHCNILLKGGVIRKHEMLGIRTPLPPGKFFCGLLVDDAGFFEKERKGRKRTDEERLSKIHGAYNKAGIGAKLSKRQRNMKEATIWGAEINGSRGWVSAPRPFILRLVWLTCKLGWRKITALGLLRSLLELWAYVLVSPSRILFVVRSIQRHRTGEAEMAAGKRRSGYTCG